MYSKAGHPVSLSKYIVHWAIGLLKAVSSLRGSSDAMQ